MRRINLDGGCVRPLRHDRSWRWKWLVLLATMYHDGSSVQAGVADGDRNASFANVAASPASGHHLERQVARERVVERDFLMYRSIPVPPPGSG